MYYGLHNQTFVISRLIRHPRTRDVLLINFDTRCSLCTHIWCRWTNQVTGYECTHPHSVSREWNVRCFTCRVVMNGAAVTRSEDVFLTGLHIFIHDDCSVWQ